MTVPAFRRAEKRGTNLRVCLAGPAGAGKTYTGLAIASGMAQPVAVIDTEHGSSNLYADAFAFDVLTLEKYSPEAFGAAIDAAREAGYKALVIDSFSHAWDGEDGMLERVESIASRSKSGNTFQAWGTATPLYRALIEKILKYPGHVIVTLRTKTEYVQEKDDRGRTQIRKVGLQPVARAGIEYEFTLVGDIDLEHRMAVTKSRAAEYADKVLHKPGVEFGRSLVAWANSGGPALAEPTPVPAPTPAPAVTTLDSNSAAVWVARMEACTKKEQVHAIGQEMRVTGISEETRNVVTPVYKRLVETLPV